jgi:shikimate dehydrogenase
MSIKKKIVSTIFVKNPLDVRNEVLLSFKSGADIVEIRIDGLKNIGVARTLLDIPEEYPVIFSGNPEFCTLSEMRFFAEAQKKGALVDIPYSEYLKIPDTLDKNKLIISFYGRVENYSFYTRLAHKLEHFAKFVKIVPYTENFCDSAQFLKWTSRMITHPRLIAFPSGPESKFAKILSAGYGSRWVYSLSPHSLKTMEGHIRLDELLKYEPLLISKETEVVGLFGYPLNYTEIPEIWNKWFRDQDIDAIFLPFILKDIPSGIAGLNYLKTKFVGVTSPHKMKILSYLDKISKKSQSCHSVNTIVDDNGKLFGFTTDIYAILRCLNFVEENDKILILGNGGATRSAIFALKRKAKIFISSRDEKKAKVLCNDYKVDFIPWKEKESGNYDVVINCTAIGSDGRNIPWQRNKGFKAKYLFDMVVTKYPTPFEKFAKDRGAKVIRGKEFLYHQAKMQFRIFFSKFLKQNQ